MGSERRCVGDCLGDCLGDCRWWTGRGGHSVRRSRDVGSGKTNVVDRLRLAWMQIDGVQLDGEACKGFGWRRECFG